MKNKKVKNLEIFYLKMVIHVATYCNNTLHFFESDVPKEFIKKNIHQN